MALRFRMDGGDTPAWDYGNGTVSAGVLGAAGWRWHSVAGVPASAKAQAADRDEMEAELALLVAQARSACARAAGTGDWSAAYDAVFSPQLSGRAAEIMDALGIEFSWTDPDMGYEDDARAYVAALGEAAEELGAGAAPRP
jgi:hypothetical protein